MNIYLIGYRCSGKTTAGKALSKQLGWPYLDTDEAVTKAAGMTIARLVSRSGWNAFREMEKRVIADTGRLQSPHVIATGGGCILDPDNVRAMKDAGCVIWLRVRPETVRARMALDLKTGDQRPGLTGMGRMNEIETVLKERAPLYNNAAHLEVEADSLGIDAVCLKIHEYLKQGDS